MALPYMWSKRKSASKIVNIIEAYCPDNEKLVIELFTGWFAIWEEFLKKGYKVIANDKNKYVIALLDKMINWKPDEAKMLKWVSRKLFKDILENPNKYDEWYVWYVMCIWSFWNNQKDYLFWEENEINKKSLFELVVNKKVDELCKKIIPVEKYIKWILKQDNWHKRRMALKKVLRVLWDRKDLQRLQSLESLERLERLGKLNSIKFISWSYEKVEIPKNAIIYCDPPYKWTAEYSEWQFNHKEFWEYIRKISKTNKVFISEYTAPDDFKAIYNFSQKSTLWKWNQSHENQPNEKLFTII